MTDVIAAVVVTKTVICPQMDARTAHRESVHEVVVVRVPVRNPVVTVGVVVVVAEVGVIDDVIDIARAIVHEHDLDHVLDRDDEATPRRLLV